MYIYEFYLCYFYFCFTFNVIDLILFKSKQILTYLDRQNMGVLGPYDMRFFGLVLKLPFIVQDLLRIGPDFWYADSLVYLSILGNLS